MKRFSEQLKKKAGSVRLRAAEKRDLRERLVAYMEYHPLPTDVVMSTQRQPAAVSNQIESFQVIRISRRFVHGLVGVMTLFLVLVPVLAERAVPGDSLYAVKVNVNEEVWSSLAFSSFEKIEWETKRLERRIAEAQVLARSGRLTPEVEALVVGAVEGHRQSAAASIEKLRSVDAEQASLAEMTLSAVLDVQSAKLSSNQAASSTTGRSTATLAQAVAISREEAESRSANATISYDRLMAYIEQETTRTYELLNSISETATPEQVGAIERRLQDIDRAIASVVAARIDIETNDTAPVMAVSIDVATTTASTTATTSTTVIATTTEQTVASEEDLINELRSIFKAVQKLIAYMTDLDLQATVQIETLLPVVLTDEESRVEQTAQREQLVRLTAQIDESVDRLATDSVQEKIQTSLGTVRRLLTESEAAMAAEDWARASQLHSEAEAFIQSMQKIFALEEISLTAPVATDGTTASTTSTTTATTSPDTIDVSETNASTSSTTVDAIE